MNVVVVSSRKVPHKYVRSIAGVLIQALLDNATEPEKPVRILLRRPITGAPAPAEGLIAEIAARLGAEYRWCYPDPRGGREGTYVRDAHMVNMADMVLAIFTPDTLMQGGTGHVVEKAIEKSVPVHAYEVDESGLRWVGDV
jgi:hypothetical protein